MRVGNVGALSLVTLSVALVLAATGVACSTAGTPNSGGNATAQAVDRRALATLACLPVDGSWATHPEIATDDYSGAYAARIKDLQKATSYARKAATAGSKYINMALKLAYLTRWTIKVATDFATNGSAFARDATGPNGTPGPYLGALVGARASCKSLGLATR